MRAALLLLVILAGCQSAAPLPQPPTGPAPATQLVWSAFPENGRAQWLDLWQKKLSGRSCVIVFCHGDTDSGRLRLIPDQAQIGLDAESVAWTLRRIYGKDVVLVSCNEKGVPINVSGVWYAKGIVWVVPGMNVRDDQKGIGDTTGFKQGSDPVIAWRR